MSLNFTETVAYRREVMITDHLLNRGIQNQQVIRAMREVHREAFIDKDMVGLAYEDYPLPIDEGQTISQPYIVAYMTEALELRSTDRVLEIGTGSGYAAAVISRIVDTVHSVERLEGLANRARQRLTQLAYTNIIIHEGDGTLGWPEHAPMTPSLLPPAPRRCRSLYSTSL